MDPMSGCDTPTLVFTLEPKDSTLQNKKLSWFTWKLLTLKVKNAIKFQNESLQIFASNI